MRRWGTAIFIILAILVFASWQYRLLCIGAVIAINSKSLKSLLDQKWEYAYSCIILLLIVGIYHTLPNYFQRGRTQVVYFDKKGQLIHTPFAVYLANCFVPEKEVMNIGFKTAGIILPIVNLFSSSHDYSLKTSQFRIGGTLTKEAVHDYWSMNRVDYYTPYNRLHIGGSHPGSLAATQLINQVTGTNYEGIYVTRPKHYNSEKKYPVVFFCHGYLGNWELYQGVFSRLDDCFVVSIGTKDMSGIFTYKDIKKIFTKYIPYMKQEGYSIDEHQLHLIGLSNGGSASNVAFSNFDHKFKTITYMSTDCRVVKHSKSKILFVGGGKDKCMFAPISSLKSCGTKVDSYIEPQDGHYMFIHHKQEFIDFLNKNYKM